jgi:transcriptional regulator with XRE-family HTH domain
MQTRIAYLRQQKGLSLGELAKAAGTTKAQIQKLERGDRRLSLEWMERLARALDTKISDLLPAEEVASAQDPADALLDVLSRLPSRDRERLIPLFKRVLRTLQAPD